MQVHVHLKFKTKILPFTHITCRWYGYVHKNVISVKKTKCSSSNIRIENVFLPYKGGLVHVCVVDSLL
jgi:hypothetical protein